MNKQDFQKKTLHMRNKESTPSVTASSNTLEIQSCLEKEGISSEESNGCTVQQSPTASTLSPLNESDSFKMDALQSNSLLPVSENSNLSIIHSVKVDKNKYALDTQQRKEPMGGENINFPSTYQFNYASGVQSPNINDYPSSDRKFISTDTLNIASISSLRQSKHLSHHSTETVSESTKHISISASSSKINKRIIAIGGKEYDDYRDELSYKVEKILGSNVLSDDGESALNVSQNEQDITKSYCLNFPTYRESRDVLQDQSFPNKKLSALAFENPFNSNSEIVDHKTNSKEMPKVKDNVRLQTAQCHYLDHLTIPCDQKITSKVDVSQKSAENSLIFPLKVSESLLDLTSPFNSIKSPPTSLQSGKPPILPNEMSGPQKFLILLKSNTATDSEILNVDETLQNLPPSANTYSYLHLQPVSASGILHESSVGNFSQSEEISGYNPISYLHWHPPIESSNLQDIKDVATQTSLSYLMEQSPQHINYLPLLHRNDSYSNKDEGMQPNNDSNSLLRRKLEALSSENTYAAFPITLPENSSQLYEQYDTSVPTYSSHSTNVPYLHADCSATEVFQREVRPRTDDTHSSDSTVQKGSKESVLPAPVIHENTSSGSSQFQSENRVESTASSTFAKCYLDIVMEELHKMQSLLVRQFEIFNQFAQKTGDDKKAIDERFDDLRSLVLELSEKLKVSNENHCASSTSELKSERQVVHWDQPVDSFICTSQRHDKNQSSRNAELGIALNAGGHFTTINHSANINGIQQDNIQARVTENKNVQGLLQNSHENKELLQISNETFIKNCLTKDENYDEKTVKAFTNASNELHEQELLYSSLNNGCRNSQTPISWCIKFKHGIKQKEDESKGSDTSLQAAFSQSCPNLVRNIGERSSHLRAMSIIRRTASFAEKSDIYKVQTLPRRSKPSPKQIDLSCPTCKHPFTRQTVQSDTSVSNPRLGTLSDSIPVNLVQQTKVRHGPHGLFVKKQLKICHEELNKLTGQTGCKAKKSKHLKTERDI